jgi:hypothetical protein
MQCRNTAAFKGEADRRLLILRAILDAHGQGMPFVEAMDLARMEVDAA